jgi:hypothetical protein
MRARLQSIGVYPTSFDLDDESLLSNVETYRSEIAQIIQELDVCDLWAAHLIIRQLGLVERAPGAIRPWIHPYNWEEHPDEVKPYLAYLKRHRHRSDDAGHPDVG